VLFKLEFIQNYFLGASKSLESILLKEREVKAAITTFQKAVALSTKEEVREIQKLSVSEKIKGDIILKVWEVNLAENKKITREVNDDCQGIFDLLEKTSLNIGKNDCPGLIGEINIVKHQLRFKEDLEEIKVEIPQIKVINVTQIDKWIVMPNLKIQTIKFTRKIIKDCLPELQRKFFLFEEKDIPEAPIVLVQFLGKCIRCLKTEGAGSSTQT
jgi:hypothetical protein